MAPFGKVSNAQACRQEAYFRQWGAVPKELTTNDPLPETVVAPGPVDGQCYVGPPAYDKQPVVSAVTAMFLHGGGVLLLCNILFLLVFGHQVRDRLGAIR